MLVLGPESDISQLGNGIFKEVILTGLQTLNKGSVETLAHTVPLCPGERVFPLPPSAKVTTLSWGACLSPLKSPVCPGERACPCAVNALSWGARLSPLKSPLCPEEHACPPEVIFASLVLYYEISSSVSKLGNSQG